MAGLNCKMGIGFIEFRDDIDKFKQKHRWMFKLIGVIGENDNTNGIYAIPPRRGGRPSVTFKEFEFQHTTETIYYPFKPEWKPIQLTLFDIYGGDSYINPVFRWINFATNQNIEAGLYQPRLSKWTPAVDAGIKRNATLEVYDAGGCAIEKWVIENCYPSTADWSEMDMDQIDIAMVDVTIRYDRAYMINPDDKANCNCCPETVSV